MNREEKIKGLKVLVERNKGKIKKYKKILNEKISIFEREKIEIQYARQLKMMNSRLERIKKLEEQND